MRDTIVALATPAGTSAIAVVRVSGSAVREICGALLPDFGMQPRLACLTKAIGDSEIDRLLAIYFPAPNSYTGEDVLELFPHGNPFIIRKLIEAICQVPDVRLANKGEFTERAFLNNKIDLSQAEALGDLLKASDSKTLANAHRLLSGEVSKEIKSLSESLKQVSATLEMEVDFSEELEHPHVGNLGLDNLLEGLRGLKKRFRISGTELPRVLLFGAPNAGKSSLANALVGEERLLVSEEAGTTRDFVELPLRLTGGDILLIDTAGLSSETQNNIDLQAMQKTKALMEKANLKVLVVDISIPPPPEFEEWKLCADLIAETHLDKMGLERGSDVEGLREKLNGFLFPEEESEAAWISSERQIACINEAEACVLRAQDALSLSHAELAAFEMREARNALRSVTGEISDDSILNLIFSSYCIGK